MAVAGVPEDPEAFLCDTDLGDVLEETIEAQTKWKKIGLKLKVPTHILNAIKGQHDSDDDRLSDTLEHWLKSVNPKPTWKALIEALKSPLVREEQLAERLEEKHCCTDPLQEGDYNQLMISLITQLRSKLKSLHQLSCEGTREEESKADMIKVAIRELIHKSSKAGGTQEQVEECLQTLHAKEFLIPEPIYKWAQQQTAETFAQLQTSHTHIDPTSETDAHDGASMPLFCKDTVYHASICSLAVNTCDAGNYQQFFKKSPTVPGHSFQELSISRSKQEHYLIARQCESTFYFAFQGIPNVSHWPQQFPSFSEGIKLQSEKFPVHLIVELLTTGNHIVLTGFSLGGLLACYITARVWGSAYIPQQLLKERLVCITFGQPHIAIPLLPEIARERDIASSIHCFYWQDDPVPHIMRFLNECCSSLREESSRAGPYVKMYVQEQPKMPFQDPVTSMLFKQMGNIQEASVWERIKMDTAVVEVQTILKGILATESSAKPLPLCTSTYLISCEGSAGLVCTKMTEEQAAVHSGYLQIPQVEEISAEMFVKYHSMAVYSQKVAWSYLDKPPSYTIPSAPAQSLNELGILKPTVTAVELHCHGNELAISVEGTNLWFCYQVSVGGHPPVNTRSISGTSIQFNIQNEKSKIEVQNDKVRVVLQSHFARPHKQDVEMHRREYSVTSRQRQLARLTPSKLIELAYMSALLEQHPHGKFQSFSHKVEVIRNFLEKVVQVVPLESIAYTIAYGSDDVALHCAKVLQHSQLQLPPSKLMDEGLMAAGHRLSSGVSPAIVERMKGKVYLEIERRHPGIVLDHHLSGIELVGWDSDQLRVLVDYNDASIPVRQRLPIQGETSLKSEELKAEYNVTPAVAPLDVQYFISDLQLQSCDAQEEAEKCDRSTIVCGLNIEVLYPISYSPDTQCVTQLHSPLDTLRNGKRKLTSLMKRAYIEALQSRSSLDTTTQTARSASMASLHNSMMLATVNQIRQNDLAVCTALLGGFMEQQKIDIPLFKSRQDRSEALSLAGAASVGVWALASLNYHAIQPILKRCHGEQLLVKIEKYVKATLSAQLAPEDDPYAAKLQFIVQGVKKTVTCNSQYISYSLERQLKELCDERKLDVSIPLDKLVGQWAVLFEENILSLVAVSHRPLIARWLKWALMVHDLREELAKYTAVGVTGLVNSGKSKLVNTLFGIQIPYGTTEAKRTTVPFMYNLDESVGGLDVLDFPGVDDRDETIPDLADLMLFLAQIVIFVVDYRKVHTESAKKWLDKLQTGNVPVLVCLTFADKLYAEHMGEDGSHPNKELMEFEVSAELSMIQEKLGEAPSRTVKFFSFSQDRDSVLNCEKGRQKLREVGIGSPLDVGDWLVDVFRRRFGQDDLADRLHTFTHKKQKQ